MKHVRFVVAAMIGLAMLGCGGSSSSGSQSTTALAPSTPRVEAVEATPVGGGADVVAGPPVDPYNLLTNEKVIFQIVNYTGPNNATRNVLAATNWTNDTTGLGVIATDTGLFSTNTQETGAGQTPTISGTYNGQTYSVYYRVTPRQVRLIGLVLAEGTNAPVEGVTINFFAPQNPNDPSSASIPVGRVTTGYDGSYRASLPTYTASMQVDNATVPSAFYRSYVFHQIRFDTGSTLCQVDLTNPAFNINLSVGDRSVVDSTVTDTTKNGTILLTPRSLYPSGEPASTGCTG